MKIAVVYDALYPYKIGGVEKRIWEVSTRLVKRGHEIHLYSVKFWRDENTIEKEGVILHGVTKFRPFYTDSRRTIMPSIIYSSRLFSPLLNESFDLIISHQFPYFSFFPIKIVCLLKKVPFVIVWHELWENHWYEYLGYLGIFGKIIEYSILFMTRNILPVSFTTQKKINRVRCEFPVIPNGIDFPQICSVSPAKIESDLIFVGRLIREKNLFLLIQALELLLHSPDPLRCVILGDGPERRNLEKKGEKLVDSGHLMFFSHIPDYESMIAMMKASKIYVSPSLREGFGITALEALASGLPVVTVNHPNNAVRDFISPETGRICKNDPLSLAAAIMDCIQNYQSMRVNCINFARVFDWNEIVNKLEMVYLNIIKEHN